MSLRSLTSGMLLAAFFAAPAWGQATNLVCNKCVNTSDLDTAAVTAAKIASNAVSNAKIANGAVTAPKLAANAVNGAKIANNSVNTAKLTTAAVTAAKLAPNSVNNSKIANAAVTAAKIAPGAVNSGKILDGAVTAAKLGIKNSVYVEAAGPSTADNCNALLAALAGVSGNSATNPFVMVLGPGSYECGAQQIVMKPHVDLIGAGTSATFLKGQVDGEFITAADGAALRLLHIENNSAGR